jgi:bisphosphoglycerate-independent phosphoglycerate mutase (AlkP superfamily)
LILSDVAPTILKIMGLEIPKDITGQSLIWTKFKGGANL